MLAAGLSNREIADRSVTSAATTEVHVIAVLGERPRRLAGASVKLQDARPGTELAKAGKGVEDSGGVAWTRALVQLGVLGKGAHSCSRRPDASTGTERIQEAMCGLHDSRARVTWPE